MDTSIAVTPELLREHASRISTQTVNLRQSQDRIRSSLDELCMALDGGAAAVIRNNAVYYINKFRASFDNLNQYAEFTATAAGEYEEADRRNGGAANGVTDGKTQSDGNSVTPGAIIAKGTEKGIYDYRYANGASPTPVYDANGNIVGYIPSGKSVWIEEKYTDANGNEICRIGAFNGMSPVYVNAQEIGDAPPGAINIGDFRYSDADNAIATYDKSGNKVGEIPAGKDVWVNYSFTDSSGVKWAQIGAVGGIAGLIVRADDLRNSNVKQAASGNASQAKIADVLKSAKAIADDDSHSYSMDVNKRWGNPDYDCSSFMITVWKNNGVDVKGATNTTNMETAFKNAGFDSIPFSDVSSGGKIDKSKLQVGDVLVNPSAGAKGHTAMIYSVNPLQMIHAHGGTKKGIDVTNYYSFGETFVLRYT